ncbi:FimV/HubP family polar landmark protein [Duganella sp. BuS-21]|uniref:FimV/HubP family polar landmark protein n=1 Tax=Duganella sp. BuS-21 TaxID=2943848 RepID=UPI0035A5D4FC
MPVHHRPYVSFALKSITSAVASTVLLAASANAAGLGKLTVLSALGQPLRAEIELTAVTQDEASALIAKLAPIEAFRSANIDFNPALLSLRFDIEQRNGKQLIKISSSQPINEPFVDMLLELSWTGGRMVREYTFLLDPPDLRATQAPQVTAPVDLGNRPAAAPAVPAPAHTQTPAPAPAAAQPAPVARPAAPAKAAASEYAVKAGDNLTRIANQVKPVDVSLDMMLVALYRANPEAFSGSNMNRLKSGQILAVPDADAIRSNGGGEGEARSVVVAHAADFNAYRAKLAGQVAAAPASAEPDASQNVSGKITAKVEEKPTATNTAKDKLTLSKATAAAAPQQGKTGAAAVAEEKLAKQKQVDEAASRVKELEKNVNDLEKLMALKNKAAADVKPAPEVAASAPVIDNTPAEVKPKRTLVLPPKKLVEPSLFEILMDNITYVGAAAAAVLLGALGIMASRRRKKFVVPQEESSILGETALPAPTPLIADAGGQSVDTNNSVFNSNFAPSASQLDTNEVDPVAEADVYIAYGRDAQAEEILKEALRTHPERHAVRLKLLEIYVARKDARSFETQASELYALTRGQGDEWEQAVTMGRGIDPSNPLYTMGKDGGDAQFGAAPAVAAAAAAGGVAAAAAPDFGSDFSKDFSNDFSSDFSSDAASTYAPAEPSALDLDLSRDAAPAPAAIPTISTDPLDFDADMDTALPQAADASISPASVAAETDNLMDFDLGGLSFEPVAAAAPAIEMPAPTDDMSMDFGLDLPASATQTADTKPSAATDPLDLDLAGFDIPEVPALTEPPKAPAAPLDFDTSLELPAEVENITAAPPPAAPEFDLSSIDLDLDSFGDSAPATASADTAPASSGSNEPLSAHHMEMDTKLDLAIAYQEIGDKEGARELLDEVLRGGSDEQIAKANAMKAQLS